VCQMGTNALSLTSNHCLILTFLTDHIIFKNTGEYIILLYRISFQVYTVSIYNSVGASAYFLLSVVFYLAVSFIRISFGIH
jgi:hypothetical protein